MDSAHNGDPLNEQRIRKLVDDVAGKGRELLNEGIENAKNLMHEQGEALKKKADQYGLGDATDSLKSYVQKNPLQSIGIAVAVGLILGRLLTPGRSEE